MDSNTTTSDRILTIAQQQHAQIVGYRRYLHMHPELSFQEENTGKYIQSALKEMNIPFTTGWAGTGIVARIKGDGPGKRQNILALRADMDALPIQEENDVEYVSRNPGVMHACGHDVHSSSLLGAAAILRKMSDSFSGEVILIFQPGEERMPGGASVMLKEGALDNPRPGSILGQHVHPVLPAGKVGFCPGYSMASADEITLTVRGRGGHAAIPQDTIDPIMISAEILSSLQQVISRKGDPIVPSVLSFGRIESNGGTFNVIPNDVTILGTFRTFNEEWRKEAHQHIRQVASSVAAGFGGTCDVQITVGYPSLFNDHTLTAQCMEWARELLGEDNVVEIAPRMTAEDFAYYSLEMPACFYRLGVTPPGSDAIHPVHTSTFDIDESALFTGPALMAWLALRMLTA